MANVIMITIGILGHIWIILCLLQLWLLYTSYEHQKLGQKITIHNTVFIPFTMMILFWVWMVVG